MRALNDPEQYDDLVDLWWDTGGGFAMLHWLAAARAELIPPAEPGGLLLDIACGGGLLAPHALRLGYRHVGVDLGVGATKTAANHGVMAIRADAGKLPMSDGCAQVVVAGEILEHVDDPLVVVAEAARVLAAGGTVIIDSIAATRWGRFTAVTVAERIPGGPPRRLHDPGLFVEPREIGRAFALAGIDLRLHGLIPDPIGYARWLLDRRRSVRMRRVPGITGLFGGIGVKVTG